MAWKDDDELRAPSSNPEGFVSQLKAKLSALRAKVKEQKGRDVDVQRLTLKEQMERQKIHEELEGMKEEETKRQKRTEEEAKQTQTFGTKTHKQLEEREVLAAETQQDAEQLISEEDRQKTEKAQAAEEYQQNAG